VAEGEPGKADIRHHDRQRYQREEPVERRHRPARKHEHRQRHQQRRAKRRQPRAEQQRVGQRIGVRRARVRQFLGKAALQPDRRQLCGQLDDQDRIAEAPDRAAPI
jgi:hypothetical protein